MDFGLVLGAMGVVIAFVAVGIGIVMANPKPPEILFAKVCFWLAAVLAMLSSVWLTKEYPLDAVKITVTAVFGAAIAVALVSGLNWATRRTVNETTDNPFRPPSRISDIEMQTMRDVDNWVGVMDENSLRNIFDIPNVLDRNLGYISKTGQPYHGEPVEGRVPIFGRIPDISLLRGPTNNGLAVMNPGTVSLIFTTDVYESSKDKLDKYSRSAYLSDEIRSLLAEMSKRIDTDLNLMITVLDKEYKTDTNSITKYKEPSFVGAVSNTYFDSFLPLRPVAENISAAIRSRVRGAE